MYRLEVRWTYLPAPIRSAYMEYTLVMVSNTRQLGIVSITQDYCRLVPSSQTSTQKSYTSKSAV